MKKEKVSVYWLVNSLIHNWHDVVFLESTYNYETNNWDEHIICTWDDVDYRKNKEEIYQREISFITVTDKIIRVFLKEKK